MLGYIKMRNNMRPFSKERHMKKLFVKGIIDIVGLVATLAVTAIILDIAIGDIYTEKLQLMLLAQQNSEVVSLQSYNKETALAIMCALFANCISLKFLSVGFMNLGCAFEMWMNSKYPPRKSPLGKLSDVAENSDDE